MPGARQNDLVEVLSATHDPNVCLTPTQLAGMSGAGVLQTYYNAGMGGTTTIRLSDEDRQLLAQLVPEYGDQSSVIRHGIRRLAEEQRQRQELRALLEEWEAESGPVDEDMVAEMQRRYFNR